MHHTKGTMKILFESSIVNQNLQLTHYGFDCLWVASLDTIGTERWHQYHPPSKNHFFNEWTATWRKPNRHPENEIELTHWSLNDHIIRHFRKHCLRQWHCLMTPSHSLKHCWLPDFCSIWCQCSWYVFLSEFGTKIPLFHLVSVSELRHNVEPCDFGDLSVYSLYIIRTGFLWNWFRMWWTQ